MTRVLFPVLIRFGAQVPACYDRASECPDLKEAVHELCGDENPVLRSMPNGMSRVFSKQKT